MSFLDDYRDIVNMVLDERKKDLALNFYNLVGAKDFDNTIKIDDLKLKKKALELADGIIRDVFEEVERRGKYGK